MGAWIETPASRAMPPIRSVAHYVGAWIETKVSADSRLSSTSHPTWVRGLKLEYWAAYCAPSGSHPTWVRGLKPYTRLVDLRLQRSHPTWVRGLKQQYHVGLESNYGRTLRGCVD